MFPLGTYNKNISSSFKEQKEGIELTITRESLKAIREEKGFSHKEIAGILGISRSHYTRIERGTRNPSLAVIRKMSLVLDIDVTFFLLETVPFCDIDKNVS